jgi:lysophospholipase L1-like esterase
MRKTIAVASILLVLALVALLFHHHATSPKRGNLVSDFLSDTFTDADATSLPLHVSDDGHGIRKFQTVFADASCEINSNEVYASVDGAGAFYWDAFPLTADGVFTLNFDLKTAAGLSAGYIFRGADESHFLLLIYNVDQTRFEFYTNTGSLVELTALRSGAVGATSGAHTVVLTLSSTSISYTVDGGSAISTTDSSVTAAGRCGVWVVGVTSPTTGVHLNSFAATETGLSSDTKDFAFSFDGDSITLGYGLTLPEAYPALVAAAVDTHSYWEWGVGGQRVDEMNADAAFQVDGVYPQTSAYTYRVASLLGGINDCYNGDSAATIEGRIQTWWVRARAKGWKVLGMTITPARSVTGAAETVRQTVNTWIRANHATYCDYFADIDGDSRLQDPENATYFQAVDGVHPTAAGQQVIADLIVASLPQSIPSTPTSLAHGTVTSTTVPLTWDAMTGADGYLVKYDTDSGFANNYDPIDTASAMTTALALDPNTQYYFKVAAYNDAGTSAYCVAITATTSALPLVAPVLSRVSKTDTSVTVSWTDATGGTPGYFYELSWGVSSGNYSTGSTEDVTSPEETTGLTKGTRYYFIIAATDADGMGDTVYSNEVAVTPGAVANAAILCETFGYGFGF